MTKALKEFKNSEDGAVSADWVAITAAVMILAVSIAGILNSSTVAAGQQIGDDVSAMATP